MASARVEDGAQELDMKVFHSYLREVVPNAIGGSVGELNDALELNPALMQRYVLAPARVWWFVEEGGGRVQPFSRLKNVVRSRPAVESYILVWLSLENASFQQPPHQSRTSP
jgi:hypothetical protein